MLAVGFMLGMAGAMLAGFQLGRAWERTTPISPPEPPSSVPDFVPEWMLAGGEETA